MVNTMISIPGYVHLYRSLLRFYDMPENEVREMLYRQPQGRVMPSFRIFRCLFSMTACSS